MVYNVKWWAGYGLHVMSIRQGMVYNVSCQIGYGLKCYKYQTGYGLWQVLLKNIRQIMAYSFTSIRQVIYVV